MGEFAAIRTGEGITTCCDDGATGGKGGCPTSGKLEGCVAIMYEDAAGDKTAAAAAGGTVSVGPVRAIASVMPTNDGWLSLSCLNLVGVMVITRLLFTGFMVCGFSAMVQKGSRVENGRKKERK